MINLNQEIPKRPGCVDGGRGLGQGHCALLRRLCRGNSVILSRNPGRKNAASFMQPGGNSPCAPQENLPQNFPTSHCLLNLSVNVLQQFNSIHLYIYHISICLSTYLIPLEEKQKGTNNVSGKSVSKAFRTPDTAMLCLHADLHAHAPLFTLCTLLGSRRTLPAGSPTCKPDPAHGSSETSSNLKWGVTVTPSF